MRRESTFDVIFVLMTQIPYITSGRIDLRETDTETAFRIINFLDEQKGQTITSITQTPHIPESFVLSTVQATVGAPLACSEVYKAQLQEFLSLQELQKLL